jgi:hypothetical protein
MPTYTDARRWLKKTGKYWRASGATRSRPWTARAIEQLNAAPDHHAGHLVLERAMRIDSDDKEAATYAKEELGRLRKEGPSTGAPNRKLGLSFPIRLREWPT